VSKRKGQPSSGERKSNVPKKTGRPSSYSLELGDLICALLAEGKSLRKICALDNMPVMSTVLLWVMKGERGDREYEAFSEQYRDAREAQAEYWADELIDISDDDSNDYAFKESDDKSGSSAKAFIVQDNINRAKLRVHTRMWVASKLRPKKYGDKVTQEITGKDGGPVELTDAKAALLRGIVPDATSGRTDPKDK
jgi:hypothetical protein